ncbi:hypothetical protein CHGG_10334 [Chaetomium globosum CBS 148.51]|uniref:ER membrane protein complex subunit 7 beta-sandwich domain-containing protein n=1 Tax=Chaetomium globosum (strain ATCC 6205 / CBS 148.51 / DSM 1962 / NBRC 6347 / NRRL 1970) TaxID=306901 RepID=Q2GNX0_CHAGB|nr:uncharacterized protein CHGG_10334 [Chaetomium globosum CBS 148.51]EAQ83930.1 hypothetical protein CHGG_10334 [Chaetomium globosum CBS 148.51]
MHLNTLLLLPLLSALTPLTTASKPTTPNHDHDLETTTLTLRIPPTNPSLPNAHLLPASTRATLTTLGRALSAPLSVANTFVFRNVSVGSYLADVHCVSHAFAPLRVDVAAAEGADGGGGKKGSGSGLGVRAWETFRGGDWGNTGEGAPVGEYSGGGGHVVEVRVLGAKGYFMERSSFSVLSIFKNPMILLGLVSMALFFGMPKLVENMDPEMRAEWEERQKENPMNSIMGAASGQNANPMGNFDMAAFLAGSGSSKAEEGGAKGKTEGKKKR